MLSLALVVLAAPRISYSQLAADMWSLSSLCEYPEPFYVTRQASSYDRNSKSPGNEAWFANQDWGNFVRDEQVDGRKEHVLIDVPGPGTMVRYWSPNPAGVTRIYLDGACAIEAKTADLLAGKIAPFHSPLAETTAKGWSLYCPVSFQKSLKVTVDDSDKDAGGKMYYQVQYRDYDDSVTVEPFSAGAVAKDELSQKVARRMASRPNETTDWASSSVSSGKSLTIDLQGPSVIKALSVELPPQPRDATWADPRAWHNLLRSIRVTGDFDTEHCIDTPLGDFMSSSLGVSPTQSLPVEVTKSGRMTLYFPMPFKTSARLRFENLSKQTVRLKVGTQTDRYQWSDRSMHFKAQWLCYQGNTRPMIDIPYLHAEGQGVFVGCNAGVSNPVAAWWGEGDEKISVDNEAFPSTFGTGTEDYFGYGWCDQTLFAHAYHLQSRCDGPGNKGHTNVARWQILDRMPFRKSFNFDMELWHWAECDIMYGRTAYWYAKPGGSHPASDIGAKFLPPFIEGVMRVKGAVEGEETKIVSMSSGVNEIQGFDDLSNGKQLWWRNADVGGKLVLKPDLPNPGRYHVMARCCFAKDYGVQKISFGDISQTVDFFGDLTWKTVDLGVTTIRGNETLTVEVQTPNPNAVAGNMFGLDYIVFVKE